MIASLVFTGYLVMIHLIRNEPRKTKVTNMCLEIPVLRQRSSPEAWPPQQRSLRATRESFGCIGTIEAHTYA
jgi:hypothetical protein